MVGGAKEGTDVSTPCAMIALGGSRGGTSPSAPLELAAVSSGGHSLLSDMAATTGDILNLDSTSAATASSLESFFSSTGTGTGSGDDGESFKNG